MPSIRLTDASLSRLKTPRTGQVDYFDTVLPSFGVRVSHKGRRTFVLMDRVGGRLRRLTIGRYPTMSLAEARRKAEEWKVVASRGLDPPEEEARLAAEAEARQRRRRANSFAAVAQRFLAAQANRLRASTLNEYRRILSSGDISDWLDRPIDAITRQDVTDLLGRIDARGFASASRHALSYLKVFFNWCAESGLIETSPTDRVRVRSSARSRDRVLAADELAAIVEALGDDDGIVLMRGVDKEKLPALGVMPRDFFMVLLLTGQRRGEVAGMRWDEISGLDSAEPLWTIPSDRTKNHREHLVPLAPAVAAILLRRKKTRGKSAFVFSGTGETALSGFSHAKASLAARANAIRKAEGKKPLAPWTAHDFRRTMVTVMNEELGIAPHVVEAIVNHVSGAAKAGVAGVYNRALYLRERREALSAWSRRVSPRW